MGESEKWKWSRVRFFATPWTAAHQAPPSMGFSRQEYWSGVPSPSPKSLVRNKSTVLTSVCAQSCPDFYNSMDCRLPGSSDHGIFQARIQEWMAISSSWGSFWLRDQTHVSCIGRQMLYRWTTWEAQFSLFQFVFSDKNSECKGSPALTMLIEENKSLNLWVILPR